MIPSDDPRTKALLAARAEHSRGRTDAAGAGFADRALLFEAGAFGIAVPEANLLGVVRDPRITPVPGSAGGCLGAVAFRSRFYDVFSLFGLLGIEPPGGGPGHAVICTARTRAFGLWCGVPSGFVTAGPDRSAEVSATWPRALRTRLDTGAYLLDVNELLRLPAFSSTNEP